MDSKQLIGAIINDPGASFWLKNAVTALQDRDPVDALHDVEILLEFCRLRVDEARRQL